MCSNCKKNGSGISCNCPHGTELTNCGCEAGLASCESCGHKC